MDDLSRVEYEALRTTIRQRGSLRTSLMIAGFAVWGALAIVAAAYGEGAEILVPLIVLAAAIEAGYTLYTGVERIGRFIQIFYESPAQALGPAWETTVMAYSRSYPGTGPDPLFARLYVFAALINFLTLVGPVPRRPGWLLLALIGHAAFVWRIRKARGSLAARNAIDLDRFRNLKAVFPGS